MLLTDNVAVQQLAKRIENKDVEFKKQHFAVKELVNKEEAVSGEQDTMNKHNNQGAEISDCIQQLKSHEKAASVPVLGAIPASDPAIQLSKHLEYMEGRLVGIQEEIRSLTSGPELNTYLVQLLQRRVNHIIN